MAQLNEITEFTNKNLNFSLLMRQRCNCELSSVREGFFLLLSSLVPFSRLDWCEKKS